MEGLLRDPDKLRSVNRALMAGNFAIGCGVMVVAGSLNDLVHSLRVSVPIGGQLVSVAALSMALGAPLLAAAFGRWDRRRLLTLALAWYALGHAICALMPGYAALLPVRALTVLGAAVFTPQAAAAMQVLAPAAQRGQAITFIFLGWSLSSVIGMPLHSFIGETWGWRWAFVLVAVLSAVAALWVWRVLPAGVHTAPLSLRGWGRVLSSPLLMSLVLLTVCNAAGQFTLFSYFAPYYRQVLGTGAEGVSLLFLWFGAVALLGNLLLTRYIERWGSAHSVSVSLALMALSMLLWPLATSVASMVLVLMPWALGCFSGNSAQQARISVAAPSLAGGMLALNTSAIYLGQALGAAGGGALLAHSGFAPLPWAALAWMLLALLLSLGLAHKMQGRPVHD